MAWVTAIKTFFVSTSIWGAIKVVAAVAYVINLWTQYKKAKQSPTYSFDIQTQSSNELPVPVVYGRVKAGGNIVLQVILHNNSPAIALGTPGECIF